MSTIMDDSCQDFVDLSSKLLKRTRKKQGEPRQQRKAEKRPPSRSGDGAKRKRNHNKDGVSGAQPGGAPAEAVLRVVGGGRGFESGDAGGAGAEWTAKDKVLQRMQEFRKTSPQKMVYADSNPTLDGDGAPPPTLMKRKGEITDNWERQLCGKEGR